ncbi:MAG: UDP-glucose 4-epimerase GalE, partial [Paludibacteraceae bacterium]|nr:UDP-glucose 4-epimerase GalE [Paludibacteraceae bacterium]
LKAVGESQQIPIAYYANNLGSLLTLLKVMQAHRVKKIVFSSSCTVYGEPEFSPVTEQSPIQPATSPYGATKQMCEYILQDAVKADQELSVTALRYFNPIGAHESALIGEVPYGTPQNLVPYLTQAAAGIRQKLQVFGNNYPTPDGTCIRDFIHVSDLAQAHLCALNHMFDSPSGWRVYNIGTGRGTSVKELIDAFERATGVPVPFQYAPRRSGDIERVWADAQLAEKELGWKSQKTLEETLLSAWRWQQHITNLEK